MAEEKILFDVPENYTDSGKEIMSNYDHIVNESVRDYLMKNDQYAGYPGWNFYATVWYDKGQKLWFGRVKQYGTHIDTMSARTPDELRVLISDEYGYQ